MTRIISGLAGSLKLASPAKVTRPTSDRIRESIFAMLESRDLIEGASVLDLYAGTGALALEAVSRGASRAVMVERDGKAAAVCVANLKSVQKSLEKADVEANIRVVNKSCQSFVANVSPGEYSLVFIDPPYEVSNSEVETILKALAPSLSPQATVVLERSSRGEMPKVEPEFELEETKNYGDTVVFWLTNA
jgi:16S rRNA (guanine966-N2)-methyltransferase